MKSTHVIVFARAPRIGNGKRRLARDMGNRRALHFYNTNLKRLLVELSRGPWQFHVAVASESDRHHPIFRDMSVLVQPHGDLGRRMRSVLAQFNGSTRLIVGSDIPELNGAHVGRALAELSTHHIVFGPAVDGGFWGVGCNPMYKPRADFMRNVRWSSSHTLTDTKQTITPNCRVAEAARLADVDDGGALKV